MNHLIHPCTARSVCVCFILVALWFFLGGCVAVQPFPSAARSGDTIILVVGSADGMTETNTEVRYYSDPLSDPDDPFNYTSIPIREIVKVYPDKTSMVWLTHTSVSDDAQSIPNRSSHGPWMSVVVVDLPTLSEHTGGVMRVIADGEVQFPRFSATPNGTDIPITILPGTGTSHPFEYLSAEGFGATAGDLSKLGGLFQVIVKPEVPAEGQAQAVSFGAIEMNMTIPIAELNGGSVLDEGIAVVLDDQPQNIVNQTQLIWRRNGNDFDIMLVSPKGMYGHEARVSIVPRWPEYLYGVNGPPVLNSITYYDLNGDLHPGPLPAMPEVVSITNPNF
jgi:hypothetical protein